MLRLTSSSLGFALAVGSGSTALDVSGDLASLLGGVAASATSRASVGEDFWGSVGVAFAEVSGASACASSVSSVAALATGEGTDEGVPDGTSDGAGDGA